MSHYVAGLRSLETDPADAGIGFVVVEVIPMALGVRARLTQEDQSHIHIAIGLYLCLGSGVDGEPGIAEAARLFKVLGSESRLGLLRLIDDKPQTVGMLAEMTGMSQPLVSQHLRTLRQAGLVTSTRAGKEVTYRVADLHVAHIVADALVHVLEPGAPGSQGQGQHTRNTLTTEGNDMTTSAEHAAAEHTTTDHEHGLDCGHETVQHGDHVDYVHDGHKHALHDDHYDEH